MSICGFELPEALRPEQFQKFSILANKLFSDDDYHLKRQPFGEESFIITMGMSTHYKAGIEFYHPLKMLQTQQLYQITPFTLGLMFILTSSPHSVTVTSFPDMSIRLSVLLDTSLLDLVVRRVTSSTLLQTPITSVMENMNQCDTLAADTGSTFLFPT